MPSILITGVSSGIGNALARRARTAGWQVLGTVRDASAGAHGLPEEVALLSLDLADAEGVRAFAASVLADHGAPDVIVNNAGFTLYGPVEEIAPERTREVFQVNVFGPIELVAAMLPAMRDRGSGLVVNVTSLGGRLTFPFFTTYNATKHALEGYSEGLWHELEPFGVGVKVIEPGYVETPIYKSMAERAAPSGPYARMLEAMNRFSAGVRKRSTPEEAAEEIWAAITDGGDRLRYPVAAYARFLLRLRAIIGGQRFIRLMHRRWLG